MPDFTKEGLIYEVYVRSPQDLAPPLRSDVAYVPDGMIDMAGQEIVVPQGGLTIRGIDFAISGLIDSTNDHTMFVDDGVFSGRLSLHDLFISVSGTNSITGVLDNDGNNSAAEFVDVNFINCTELIQMDNYRQLFMDDVAFINCTDGFTLDGTMGGGIVLTNAVVIETPTTEIMGMALPLVEFSGALLKKGASLSLQGRVRSNLNALDISDSASVCDFEPDNIVSDASFLIDGLAVNKDSDAFPNMPASSVKANFKNCTGTEDTHIGGQWSISTEIPTAIVGANTPVKLAGETAYIDLQHFIDPPTADNAFEYGGTDEIDVAVNVTISLSGTNNHVAKILIVQWDSSADSGNGAYVTLATSGGSTLNAAGRAEDVGLVSTARMNTDDRIEIWVENNTPSSTITAELGGIVIISER